MKQIYQWQTRPMTNAERNIGIRLVPLLAALIIGALIVVLAVCR